MTTIVHDSLSIQRAKLFQSATRILGFERTGAQIQQSLDDVLEDLLQAGKLVLIDDRISTP